jgi:hypothetical protein
LAQKKAQAACKEKAVVAQAPDPMGLADIPEFRKHPHLSSPNESSKAIFSTEEELKVLQFKAWKGTFNLAENLHLAALRGCSSRALGRVESGLGWNCLGPVGAVICEKCEPPFVIFRFGSACLMSVCGLSYYTVLLSFHINVPFSLKLAPKIP